MTDFIAELIKRWGAKQPWFFKVITNVSLALAVVIGLPGFLDSVGVWDVLPENVTQVISQIVFYAGLAVSFIAKLTVTSKDKKDLSIKD